MTVLRVFPFIGALVAIAAVVLTVVGVSTDYWIATDLKTHAGHTFLIISVGKIIIVF